MTEAASKSRPARGSLKLVVKLPGKVTSTPKEERYTPQDDGDRFEPPPMPARNVTARFTQKEQPQSLFIRIPRSVWEEQRQICLLDMPSVKKRKAAQQEPDESFRPTKKRKESNTRETSRASTKPPPKKPPPAPKEPKHRTPRSKAQAPKFQASRVTTRKVQPPLKKNLSNVLKQLIKLDSYSVFLDPVTEDIAPDYFSIISEPMCFRVMLEKDTAGAYTTVDLFERDFRLICENCMKYNPPSSGYHHDAKKLLSEGLKLINNTRSHVRDGDVEGGEEDDGDDHRFTIDKADYALDEEDEEVDDEEDDDEQEYEQEDDDEDEDEDDHVILEDAGDDEGHDSQDEYTTPRMPKLLPRAKSALATPTAERTSSLPSSTQHTHATRNTSPPESSQRPAPVASPYVAPTPSTTFSSTPSTATSSNAPAESSGDANNSPMPNIPLAQTKTTVFYNGADFGYNTFCKVKPQLNIPSILPNYVNYTKNAVGLNVPVPRPFAARNVYRTTPDAYQQSVQKFVANMDPAAKARAALFLDILKQPPLNEDSQKHLTQLTIDKLDLDNNPLGASRAEIEFLKHLDGFDTSLISNLEERLQKLSHISEKDKVSTQHHQPPLVPSQVPYWG